MFNRTEEQKTNKDAEEEYKHSLIMCGVCGISAVISFYVTLKTSGQIFEPIAGLCSGLSMAGMIFSGFNASMCKDVINESAQDKVKE